jgi:hypothetical protein
MTRQITHGKTIMSLCPTDREVQAGKETLSKNRADTNKEDQTAFGPQTRITNSQAQGQERSQVRFLIRKSHSRKPKQESPTGPTKSTRAGTSRMRRAPRYSTTEESQGKGTHTHTPKPTDGNNSIRTPNTTMSTHRGLLEDIRRNGRLREQQGY